MKKRLLLHFCPTQEGTLYEQFLVVRQEGTVAAYQREFEILANLLKEIYEVMESPFMNGLLPKVRAKIHLLQPYGLGHMMKMAQWVEDINLTLQATCEQRGPKNTKILSLQIGRTERLGKIFRLRQWLLARRRRTNDARF